MVALRDEEEDELCVAVIPVVGAEPFEVSLYPLDQEWDCECEAPEPCAHIIAALMAAVAGALADEDEMLERYPPKPKPKPPPPVREEPPPPEVKARANALRVQEPARRKKAPAPESAATARTPRRKPAPVRKVDRRTPKARRQPGTVSYRLVRSSYGLAVERWVVFEDDKIRLKRKLTGDDADQAPAVATSEEDLLLQDALGEHWQDGVITSENVTAVLEAMALVEDLSLDGKRVEPRDEVLAEMVAFVEDFADDKVRVQVRPHPRVDEAFDNNLCVRDGILGRLVDDTQLTDLERRQMDVGRVFGNVELMSLALNVLPDLEKRVRLIRAASRVPKVVLSEPRAVAFVTVAGDRIEAEGMVVYGDPIIAKIVRNRLVPVDNEIPLREPEEERPLANSLRRDLGLTPGEPLSFEGAAAQRFAARLAAWEDGDVIGEGWQDLVP